MAELGSNPGKCPSLALLLAPLGEVLDSWPAERQLELRRACLQQVLEAYSDRANGLGKWRQFSTGASSADPELEQGARVNEFL